MFNELNNINEKPKPYEFYTTQELWADEYRSKKMLKHHLDDQVDISSRNHNFIEKSVSWIISYFDLNEKSYLADFGCGPGLYTSRFASKRINVTGIDFSKNSIEYARNIAKEKSLNIDYIYENYLEYKEDKKFDLITMIFCDICVLSPIQRKILLTIFKNHLKDNGNVLLDVFSIKAFNEIQAGVHFKKVIKDGFWSPNVYYEFLNKFKYEGEKVGLDKYTIVEKSKTYTAFNWLQYYDKSMIKKEFEENGFQIVNYFGDVAGSEYNESLNEFAVVAKKM